MTNSEQNDTPLDEDTDAESDLIESTPQSGIARCAPLDGQTAPYTVHGVAIGEDEVTYGQNGAKFWPKDELAKAAGSLVGVPLNKNHDDKRVESVIGEVVDASYEDGVGVVFEAEVDDEKLATKIARGRLEVSIHARHTSGGQTDDGAIIAENIRFLDLSVVPRGASPSNHVEFGASPSEALASLSADDVATMLTPVSEDGDADPVSPDRQSGSVTEPSTDSNMTEDSQITDESTETPEDSEEAELDEDVESETPEEPEEAELDEDVDTEGDADEAELEDDVTPDEPESEDEPTVDELREQIDELEAENATLHEELDDVRMEYAECLAGDGPFTASELAEKFTFDELAEKYDESDTSLVEETQTSTPSPRTGDVESDELSTAPPSDETEERIEVLEQQKETYSRLGWDAALEEVEAELTELSE